MSIITCSLIQTHNLLFSLSYSCIRFDDKRIVSGAYDGLATDVIGYSFYCYY